MAAIQTRVTKLEAHYGVASFEDLIRTMTTEDLDRLADAYARVNTDRPGDEATLADILAIERRYR